MGSVLYFIRYFLFGYVETLISFTNITQLTTFKIIMLNNKTLEDFQIKKTGYLELKNMIWIVQDSWLDTDRISTIFTNPINKANSIILLVDFAIFELKIRVL